MRASRSARLSLEPASAAADFLQEPPFVRREASPSGLSTAEPSPGSVEAVTHPLWPLDELAALPPAFVPHGRLSPPAPKIPVLAQRERSKTSRWAPPQLFPQHHA